MGEGKKCFLIGADEITEQLREQHLRPTSLTCPGQSQSTRAQSVLERLSSSVFFYQFPSGFPFGELRSRMGGEHRTGGEVKPTTGPLGTEEAQAPVSKAEIRDGFFGPLSQPQHHSERQPQGFKSQVGAVETRGAAVLPPHCAGGLSSGVLGVDVWGGDIICICQKKGERSDGCSTRDFQFVSR